MLKSNRTDLKIKLNRIKDGKGGKIHGQYVHGGKNQITTFNWVRVHLRFIRGYMSHVLLVPSKYLPMTEPI